MSKVFFASTKTEKQSFLEKVELIAKKAGINEIIKENDLVAVKTHFGEKGNTAFVPSFYVKKVIDLIKEKKGKPFLTDANTLYKGERSNAVDHLVIAYEHGFSYGSVGAPVIISDGLKGKDFRKVKIKGKHLDEVRISSNVLSADSFVAISHFKGHEMTGFGGAIKNVGMGLGSRSAKQVMHSGAKPHVNKDECTACGRCAEWCPVNAIKVNDYSVINEKVCYSCGECTVTCQYNAIDIQWETSAKEMQEKIVEHMIGVLGEKKGKTLFLNFLINITPNCDCWGFSDAPVTEDIGFLASTDPIAIDVASVDLLNKKAGKDIIKELWPNSDYMEQIKYGEEVGLGSSKYDLVECD